MPISSITLGNNDNNTNNNNNRIITIVIIIVIIIIICGFEVARNASSKFVSMWNV